MKRWLLTFLIVMFASTVMASSIHVTWPGNAASDHVANYNVYMKANNPSGYGFIKGQNIVGTTADTSYTVENLADSTYSFRITALDGNGNESAFSTASVITVDTTPPAQVGDPAIRARAKLIYVTWPKNASTDGVVRYKIYLRPNNADGSGFVKGQDIAGTVRGSIQGFSYIVTCASDYCVRVTAVDSKGNESEFSNPAYITVH